MTIELNCHHCGKLLKTSDDRAGRQATCPGCFQVITILALNEEYPQSAGPITDPAPLSNVSASGTATPSGNSNCCPKCAAVIPESAIRCQICGEVFEAARPEPESHSIRREIRPFPPGEVIADAWRIYSGRSGLLTGVIVSYAILSTLAVAAGRLPLRLAWLFYNEDQNVAAVIAAIAGTVSVLLAAGFVAYLHAGCLMVQLKVAREQPARWSDLFSGGPFAIRMWLNSLVFAALLSVGLALCIVPGGLVALIFWPYGYVLVDQNLPGLANLSHSQRMTQGNWGSIFIISCVSLLCVLSGYCTCMIGLVIALPYVCTLYAVAYDRMSYQTDQHKIATNANSLPS